MRIYLSIILGFVAICSAYAQSFEVIDNIGTFKGEIGEDITATIPLKNNSSRPIQIIIKRIDQIIGTGQINYFCWGDECYDPDTNQMPLSQTLYPGEITNKFKSILVGGLAEGFSSVKYLIFDSDNPSDVIEHEVTYTIEEGTEKKLIFSSKDIKITDVYPNPVEDFAIIEYNVLNININAKILIHNVLGSVISEYKLSSLENKIKIKTNDLNSGVYFYTLYVDNDGVMTHKLIVKK
ncbi:T9SS type A sorting domain-containing protein [Fulvivirga sediminis]|uniref:T9SS type A sorting domain-containing protein n=1 Tax=Fulvivirga sediminis TaxID=2803949 RepID=A0A937JZ51_9BACT|nr:T9SS type A sorting domain-containing protein [Fulvivirga sediminis]MBL3656334.1 T9SS type A sorting domain-containing protein [Fulvivirga sediminis]